MEMRRGWGTQQVQKQVPFGYAQGRLSTPLKYASLSDDSLVLANYFSEKILATN
jgi:hypothetical protein